MKRCFDITVSFLGLLLFSPFLILFAFLIKMDSPGPVFFKQERMGKGFRPFFIYKFRTMFRDAPERGRAVTSGGDPRVTRVGRFLRRTKIDELPQLINVLKGEMSLVGPRPEVRRYVELFQRDYEEILKVRPGITDPASLQFRNEEEVLGQFEHPEREYIHSILPAKIKLAREYLAQSSLFFDIGLILRTLLRMFR